MLPKQDVLTLFVTLEFMGTTEHMLQNSCGETKPPRVVSKGPAPIKIQDILSKE